VNKDVIYIILLTVLCGSVLVTYFAREIIKKCKNINDVGSAIFLLKTIGLLIATATLVMIYINR